MNPIQVFKNLITGGRNPQEAIMQMIGNTNNPVFNNLVDMAKKGDYQGVENFARNMYKEQGRDFDKEFKEFQNMLNNFR